jgi:hypothetical protein
MPSVSRAFSAEFAAKLDKAGGEMSGNLVLANAVKLRGKDTGGTPVDLAEMSAGDLRLLAGVQVQARPFVSAPQTITLTSIVTVAHGLGAVPKSVQGLLLAIAANSQAYPVGSLASIHYDAGNGRSIGTYADATNIYFTVSSLAYQIVHVGGGAASAITIGQWNLVLVAWP